MAETERIIEFDMTGQPTLFDQPGRFRDTDPATSKRAANDPGNIARFGTQRHALLEVYGAHIGPGLIPDEAGALAGVKGYSQRRRASELERAGLLRPTGDVRDGCRVLVITEAGVEELRRQLEARYPG